MAITVENISDIQKKNIAEYGLSVMYGRAIADLRDGLKPIHRKILYCMYDNGFTSNKPHVKSAKVVGDVIGRFSPHGDSSSYDAAVRMAQDFTLNHPTIDGQGNFGSINGDTAAAMRYSEMRLSKYGELLLKNVKKPNIVEMTMNYDNTIYEPTVLPVPVLNLLVNGSYGIATGFTQYVPTHNLREVNNLVTAYIKNPNMSSEELADMIMPDFPTGGVICSKNAVKAAYMTGKGSVRVRGKMNVDKNGNIVITEIPYGVTISDIQNAISEKTKDGTLEGVTNVEDLSDKKGLHIVVKLKRDTDANAMMNKLFKFAYMEVTQKIILTCTNGNSFKEYNLREIVKEWVTFRIKTVRNTYIQDLKEANYRIFILEALITCLNDIDNVVKIIKNANDANDAKVKLMKKYGFAEIQVNAILEIKLVRLTHLEINKLTDEINELKKLVNQYMNILNSPDNKAVKDIIIKELKEIGDKFGKDRKTECLEINSDISMDDLVADDSTIVVLKEDNYILRTSEDINIQNRSTKGLKFNSDKSIVDMFSARTIDNLLCFTNNGRVFCKKVYTIKESSMKNRGTKIDTYLPLKTNEKVISVICLSDKDLDDKNNGWFISLTKNGLIKRTSVDQFKNISNSGIIAVSVKPNDSLLNVKYLDSSKPTHDIIIVTKNGLAVRYDIMNINPQGRDTYGRMAMNINENDSIANFDVINDAEKDSIFIVTERGLAKEVAITDNVIKKDPKKRLVEINDGFPVFNVSSMIKGRIAITLKDDDKVADCCIVNDNVNCVLVATNSKFNAIDITSFKPTKRVAQGKTLINVDDNKVIKITKINLIV